MPYLVPVPPISMPIANDSYDKELELAFAMKSKFYDGQQIYCKAALSTLFSCGPAPRPGVVPSLVSAADLFVEIQTLRFEHAPEFQRQPGQNEIAPHRHQVAVMHSRQVSDSPLERRNDGATENHHDEERRALRSIFAKSCDTQRKNTGPHDGIAQARRHHAIDRKMAGREDSCQYKNAGQQGKRQKRLDGFLLSVEKGGDGNSHKNGVWIQIRNVSTIKVIDEQCNTERNKRHNDRRDALSGFSQVEYPDRSRPAADHQTCPIETHVLGDLAFVQARIRQVMRHAQQRPEIIVDGHLYTYIEEYPEHPIDKLRILHSPPMARVFNGHPIRGKKDTQYDDQGDDQKRKLLDIGQLADDDDDADQQRHQDERSRSFV